jgi:hypothetical protein
MYYALAPAPNLLAFPYLLASGKFEVEVEVLGFRSLSGEGFGVGILVFGAYPGLSSPVGVTSRLGGSGTFPA